MYGRHDCRISVKFDQRETWHGPLRCAKFHVGRRIFGVPPKKRNAKNCQLFAPQGRNSCPMLVKSVGFMWVIGLQTSLTFGAIWLVNQGFIGKNRDGAFSPYFGLGRCAGCKIQHISRPIFKGNFLKPSSQSWERPTPYALPMWVSHFRQVVSFQNHSTVNATLCQILHFMPHCPPPCKNYWTDKRNG